jgi:predicted DNA binding CopG/RHH family protein
MIESDKHLNPEQIAMCADALNTSTYDNLPESIKIHLEDCDDCAAEVVEVAQISYKYEKNIETKKKHIIFKQRLLYSLASVAAIALIFLVFKSFIHQKNEVSNIATISDTVDLKVTENLSDSSIILPSNHELIATDNKNDNKIKVYQENKHLETLVNNFQDSYRSSDIRIISKNTVNCVMPCTLKWDNPHSQELRFELFNNQEEVVFETITKSNQVSIDKIPKGLYYWKLIDADYNLLFVGKIKYQ